MMTLGPILRAIRWVAAAALIAASAPARAAEEELVMKLLVVNPSETDVKEFDIRSPLPPEIKPEHVLNADGLKVDYDAREGLYMLVGAVTLKPKEALTKRIVLQDVWVVPADRLSGLRRETQEIKAKLTKTPYEERGDMMIRAVERRLAAVEDSQDQPFMNPSQHLTRYHDNLKTLDLAETDMVSLRQLMVMAALNPATAQQQPAVVVVSGAGGDAQTGGGAEKGGLSVLATWKIIFIILGLLGFISISFFLIWQRQLKQQLAKQSAEDGSGSSGMPGNGHGTASPTDAESLLRLPPTPTPPAGPAPR